MAVLTIGLTGGIASGKSCVSDTLIRLSVPVLDGDHAARAVVAPGQPALDEIFEAFGPEFRLPNGQLDRRRMRERVFSDTDDRRRLEEITHPRIRQYLLDWRDRQVAPYCVLAVPILIESGLDALVDRILLVDTPEALQLQRLQARDGISPELARQMLDAQATRKQRLDRADDVLQNNGDLASLEAATAQLHTTYLDLARTGMNRSPTAGRL